MALQILQYEFLGPVRLSEWGPPMESTVYILLARKGDNFTIIYAGDCKSTDAADYFTGDDHFKCWHLEAGREDMLYIAIYPMNDSDDRARAMVLHKILARYKPVCNGE